MIKNNLQELLDNKVIDPDTAERIIAFYENKKSAGPNKMMMLFGILGSILAGLGLLLIIAHNWDNISITGKLIFAGIPLLISQGLSAYAYLRKQSSKNWGESTASLLFLAIGGTMAMITQIYHIQGNEKDFIFYWTLLALPIMYVINSSIASLLFFSLITYFGILDFDNPETGIYISRYWYLLLAGLPFYYIVSQRQVKSISTIFLHWVVPASLVIMTGSLFQSSTVWLYSVFAFLFALYLQIARFSGFSSYPGFQNGYQVIGFAGLLIMLYMTSFESFWDHVSYLKSEKFSYDYCFWTSCILLLISMILVFRKNWKDSGSMIYYFSIVFFLFLMIPVSSFLPAVIFNFYILSLGILTVRSGLNKHHLGVMNLGISIISVLIICRFFDSEIPFILKGFLFLIVGVSFFIANYYVARKQSKHAA